MAKGIESERRAIEAEELKLKERRARLAEMETAEVLDAFEKSSLRSLSADHISEIGKAVKRLGIAEVVTRLA